MSRRMEGHSGTTKGKDLAVFHRIDWSVWTDAAAKDALSFPAAEITSHAPTGVVAVGVSNYRPLHWLPGIDKEISFGTI